MKEKTMSKHNSIIEKKGITLLDEINDPKTLKKLSIDQLKLLAKEIRSTIIDTVSKTGGHLASSLGAVEISIALHYFYDSPNDKII